MKKIIFFLLISVVLVSCSEYRKVLKSDNNDLKWEMANTYYENGKYNKAIGLLEQLQAPNKGTNKAEKTLFMLGDSYYKKKDYMSAQNYFDIYTKTFPRGEYAEKCRFLTGKAAYVNSPDARLSQIETYSAIRSLTSFLEYYPDSERKDDVEKMIQELNDKLVYKELLNCQLYYNLGNYMGNNYKSCIVTANDVLLDYPSTKYKERLSMLVLKSKYMIASHSVEKLLVDRYKDTIDEYYSFINDFPKSKYRKEADDIYKKCIKVTKE